jgi:hypothetical protein
MNGNHSLVGLLMLLCWFGTIMRCEVAATKKHLVELSLSRCFWLLSNDNTGR